MGGYNKQQVKAEEGGGTCGKQFFQHWGRLRRRKSKGHQLKSYCQSLFIYFGAEGGGKQQRREGFGSKNCLANS